MNHVHIFNHVYWHLRRSMAAYLLHGNDLETVHVRVGFRRCSQCSDKELQASSISSKQWGRSFSVLG